MIKEKNCLFSDLITESNNKEFNFTGADLRNADFKNAEFRNACFRNADLRNADFSGADLRGADLRGADIRGTNFEGADLREVFLGCVPPKPYDDGGTRWYDILGSDIMCSTPHSSRPCLNRRAII